MVSAVTTARSTLHPGAAPPGARPDPGPRPTPAAPGRIAGHTSSAGTGERGRGMRAWRVLGRTGLAAVLTVLLCAGAAQPHTHLTGWIVHVADGDTFTLETARGELRVRLADVDAPERGQPYGRRAREVAGALVMGRRVEAIVVDRDRYGRAVARLTVNGQDVGAALVRAGAAWVYRRYTSDPQLIAIEAEARARQRGLWRLPARERIPPWQWRHR